MSFTTKILNMLIVFIIGFTGITSVSADNNLSVELLVGSAEQEGDFEGCSGVGCETGDSDTSFGIRVSYKLNANFATEVSYHDYGNPSESYISGGQFRDDYDSTGYSAGIKGILPLGNGFELNARIGAARVSSDYRFTQPCCRTSFDDDATDVYYGVGIQKDLGNEYFVGLEYTVFEAEFDAGGTDYDLEIKNISFSVGRKF